MNKRGKEERYMAFRSGKASYFRGLRKRHVEVEKRE